MRTMIVCVALGAATGACADVIANWQFDDDVPTNTATALATETNAPTLNATASRSDAASKYPSFDADRPGTRIWASFTGPLLNSTNAASLRFVNKDLPGNKDSASGGFATVPDNSLVRATNLTVEAFLKVDRRVNYPLVVGKVRPGNNTSWNLDFDNSGKPRVRIDSNPTNTFSGSGWNQSWTASVNVEDGKWHHVAFTYAHSTKALKLYVDYVLSASGNSYSNLVYEAGELRIASGAGARAFDGWLDEIRISDSVLTPEQFMTVTEPSSTRGYWAFDDGAPGTTASTLTNTFYAPMLHGAAEPVGGGGTKPVFSSERPPATSPRISSGLKGPLINLTNDCSLLFTNAAPPSSASGGAVSIPDSPLALRMTNFTAEAFVKVNRHVGWPLVVGKGRADGGGASWSIGLGNTGTPFARFDTQPLGTTGTGYNETLVPAVNVEDGRWHHMALTYSDANRTATIYVDYVQVGSRMTYSNLVYDASAVRIGQGCGFYPFDGWIDEVRITDRVLAPTEFLRTVQLQGTQIKVQ